MWLEQSIHEIKAVERPTGPSSNPVHNIRHCFQENNYNAWEIVAAIVNIGEEAQIREMLSSKSFPRHPRVPLATEIYAMEFEPSGAVNRRFLGRYRRNPQFVARENVELDHHDSYGQVRSGTKARERSKGSIPDSQPVKTLPDNAFQDSQQ